MRFSLDWSVSDFAWLGQSLVTLQDQIYYDVQTVTSVSDVIRDYDTSILTSQTWFRTILMKLEPVIICDVNMTCIVKSRPMLFYYFVMS